MMLNTLTGTSSVRYAVVTDSTLKSFKDVAMFKTIEDAIRGTLDEACVDGVLYPDKKHILDRMHYVYKYYNESDGQESPDGPFYPFEKGSLRKLCKETKTVVETYGDDRGETGDIVKSLLRAMNIAYNDSRFVLIKSLWSLKDTPNVTEYGKKTVTPIVRLSPKDSTYAPSIVDSGVQSIKTILDEEVEATPYHIELWSYYENGEGHGFQFDLVKDEILDEGAIDIMTEEQLNAKPPNCRIMCTKEFRSNLRKEKDATDCRSVCEEFISRKKAEQDKPLKLKPRELTDGKHGRTTLTTTRKDTSLTDLSKEAGLSHQSNTLTDQGGKALTEAAGITSALHFELDADGNIKLSMREYKDFDNHFKENTRLMKQYAKANNVEGIKVELCKVYYMAKLIEANHVYTTKTDEPALRKKMVALRSVMLNSFNHYLKIVMAAEPDFDFMSYFDDTKYGKNLTVNISRVGKLVRNILEVIL